MAQRRMFSKDITENDSFLDMPLSTQALYFHLGMQADDEGFVSPNRIVRMLGCQVDDMKILVAKKFAIQFDDGIIVIKHWKINNYIQSDRRKATTHQDKLAMLTVKKNNGYKLDTECIQNVRLVKDSIGKVRKGKVSLSLQSEDCGDDVNQIMDIFYRTVNPAINYGNKTSRKAAEWMIKKWGLESVVSMAQYACDIQGKQFAPTVTTPYQLKEKIGALKSFKERNEQKTRSFIDLTNV
jgi:hypothetical protein